jgi:hypothetical protein
MPYSTQEYQRQWRNAHKTDIAQYGRAYRRKHKKRLALQKAEYVRKNYAEVRARHNRYEARPEVQDRRRDYWYQKLYGLTLAQVKALFDQQKGRCKLCFRTLVFRRHQPNSCHVDHCHTTQQVRGLLCNKCNRGLGLLNDDPKLCERAVRYLQGETVERTHKRQKHGAPYVSESDTR